MKCALFCVLGLVWLSGLRAQQIQGVVMAKDGGPVASATITVRKAGNGPVVTYAVSDSLGRFALWLHRGDSMDITVRHLSYESWSSPIDAAWWQQGHRLINLDPRGHTLKEVVIVRPQQVLVKKDTVVYHADAFAGPETRKVSDLLAKMQGFSVGADGRLHYNGQVVERVMIDGEDLTGSSYQLVTKNLNAGYIDKVEVLLNDHENRLMRTQPGKSTVGVNLTVKKAARGRWSSTADLGIAAEKRFTASMNNFLVKQGIKQFSFVHVNNIAEDPMGDAEAYEELESGSGTVGGTRLLTPVLSSGTVIPPDLPEKYIRDNRDGAVAVMMALKPGKSTAIRLMAGYQQKYWANRLDRVVNSFPDSSQSWHLLNSIGQQQAPGSCFLKGMLTIDQGQRVVDQVHLNISVDRAGFRFYNDMALDLQDSLAERLRDHRAGVQAGWKRTVALRRKRLGILEVNGWVSALEQQLDGKSARYASFFGLPPGVYVHYQGLSVLVSGMDLRQQWLRHGSRWVVHWGLEAGLRYITMKSQAEIRQVMLDKGSARTIPNHRQQLGVFWSGQYHIRKRMELGFQANLGPEAMQWNDRWIIQAGYAMKLDMLYRISQLRNWRVMWGLDRHQPGQQGFAPDSLLSGNGEILGATRFTQPESGQVLRVSYFSNRIHQQLIWSVQAQWRSQAGRYVPSVYTTPSYQFSVGEFQRGNMAAFFMGSLEKFLPAANSKPGVSMVANWMRTHMRLNGREVVTRYGTLQWEGWWLARLSGAIQWESRARLWYTRALLEGGRVQVMNAVGWSQKLNWQWSDQGFASVLWRASPFGTGRYAHGLDVYVRYKPGKPWMLYLQGQNLLNQRHVLTRQVSPYQEELSSFRLVSRYILLGCSFQW